MMTLMRSWPRFSLRSKRGRDLRKETMTATTRVPRKRRRSPVRRRKRRVLPRKMSCEGHYSIQMASESILYQIANPLEFMD